MIEKQNELGRRYYTQGLVYVWKWNKDAIRKDKYPYTLHADCGRVAYWDHCPSIEEIKAQIVLGILEEKIKLSEIFND